MSDAKTAAEIEDILSSIRRLVSQDRNAAPAQSAPVQSAPVQSTPAPSAPAPAAQRPQILSRLVVEDRLVLTPAQRVPPSASPQDLAEVTQDSVAVQVTQLRREATRGGAQAWPEGQGPAQTTAMRLSREQAEPLDSRASQQVAQAATDRPVALSFARASLGATSQPVQDGPSEAPSRQAEAARTAPHPVNPHPTLARDTETAVAASGAQSAGPRLVLTEPVAPSAEPGQDTGAGRLHLDSPILPPDALAWESELGDPAPDLASLDWSSFTFARRPMAETYAARSRAAERLTAAQAVSRPAAPKSDISKPDLPKPDLPKPQSSVQAPSAEETLTLAAPQSAFVRPDRAEAGQTPQAAEAFVDEFQLRRRDQARVAPADHAALDASVDTPIQQEEDSIFSEEILRELVRDLIREQLQGDLGERITRNIRKLIKAEISRAISVQDLQ